MMRQIPHKIHPSKPALFENSAKQSQALYYKQITYRLLSIFSGIIIGSPIPIRAQKIVISSQIKTFAAAPMILKCCSTLIILYIPITE